VINTRTGFKNNTKELAKLPKNITNLILINKQFEKYYKLYKIKEQKQQ
jgi:hypothetical protein